MTKIKIYIDKDMQNCYNNLSIKKQIHSEENMNNQNMPNNLSNDVFYDNSFERYEVTDVIQQRAASAKNFALISMIVSCALLAILILSFGFALIFPSLGYLAILTIPISIICTLVEILIMIGAIVLNIIALSKAIKQQKEFKLYNDGPEKEALIKIINLGKIFTFIGVGVAVLSLILIVPLNILEFLFSFL